MIVNIVLLVVSFLFFTMMIVIRSIINKRHPTISSFISTKRRKSISYKKALQVWLGLQVLALLTTDKLGTNWYLAIAIPALIIYGLYAIYYSDAYQRPDELTEVSEEDYQVYKKSFERDIKISKILK